MKRFIGITGSMTGQTESKTHLQAPSHPFRSAINSFCSCKSNSPPSNPLTAFFAFSSASLSPCASLTNSSFRFGGNEASYVEIFVMDEAFDAWNSSEEDEVIRDGSEIVPPGAKAEAEAETEGPEAPPAEAARILGSFDGAAACASNSQSRQMRGKSVGV